MDNRRIVYVAGRYRAKTYFGIALNIFRAWRVAKRLWKLGYAVLCPHANTMWMSEWWPVALAPEVFLGGDLALLKHCDAILMLPNWEKSQGAVGEFEYAKQHNIPIAFSIQGLPPAK